MHLSPTVDIINFSGSRQAMFTVSSKMHYIGNFSTLNGIIISIHKSTVIVQ